MMKFKFYSAIIAGLLLIPFSADAQYRDKKNQEEAPKTEAQQLIEKAEKEQKFCPHCNAKIKGSVCPTCGKSNDLFD